MNELPPDLSAASGDLGAILQGVNARATASGSSSATGRFDEILAFHNSSVAGSRQTPDGNTSQELQTLSGLREALADLLESQESEIRIGNAEERSALVAEARAAIAQLTELLPSDAPGAPPTRLGNDENLPELQTLSALHEALADLLESLESEISVGNAEGRPALVAEARAAIAQLTELLPSGAPGTPSSGPGNDGQVHDLQRLTALREALARETNELLRGSGVAREKGLDTARISLQDSINNASVVLSEAAMNRVTFSMQGRLDEAVQGARFASRSGEAAAVSASPLTGAGSESRTPTDPALGVFGPDNTQSPQMSRLIAPGYTTPPMPTARTAAMQTLDRVVMMRRAGIDQARIQLNPPELGRVDIRLEMDGSDTRVQFLVQNAGVRESMEALLPKLRDALQQQGFDLADASFAQPDGGGSQEPEAEDPEGWHGPGGSESHGGADGQAASGGRLVLDPSRLLDMYA